MTEGNDDGSLSSRSSSSGGSSVVGGSTGCSSHVTTTSSYLVRVRAQVMMRDDSRGGWLPRGGGGLSNVSVLKRVSHPNPPIHQHHHHHHGNSTASNPLPSLPLSNQQHSHHHHPHNHHHPLHHHHHHHLMQSSSYQHAGPLQPPLPPPPPPQHHQSCSLHLDGPTKEYLIYGKKISDQSVVLSCSIRKDFEYNKVMPTFHHWKTGDHKFGLTFQTAADARAFDKGVHQAVKELMDGLMESGPLPPPPALPSGPPPHPVPSPLPSLYFHPSNYYSPSSFYSAVLDDSSPPEEDVFVAVNLPVSSDSAAASSAASDGQTPPPLPPLPATFPPMGVDVPGGGYHHQQHHYHPTTATSPTHLQRISYQHRPTRPPPALPPLTPGVGTEVGGSGGGAVTVTAPEDQQQHKRLDPSRDGGTDGDKGGGGGGGEQYTYAQFKSECSSQSQQQQPHTHDYYLPVMEGKKTSDAGKERRDSIASIKKANQQQQEQLAISTTMSSGGGGGGFGIGKRNSRSGAGGTAEGGGFVKSRCGSIVKRSGGGGFGGTFAAVGLKQRCRHCHYNYYPDNNPKGSCEYAPDLVRSAIDTLTCIGCAQCMLYHCMSDEEGEFVRHPCSCHDTSRRCCCCCWCLDRGTGGSDSSDPSAPTAASEMMGHGGSGDSGMENGSGSGCGRRWIGLTLLSLLVPCLCCYLPLHACHSAFVWCGVCGGRHDPMSAGGRHSTGGADTGQYGSKSVDGKLNSGRSGARYGGRYSGRFDVVGGS